MHIRLLTTLLVIALLPAADTATVDSSRAFLMSAFDLSALQIARLDRGEVVSRTLDVENRREVATLGIVRIGTSPSRYAERLADITTFKRTGDVLQVGLFSSVPQVADVAALSLDQAELKRLRACRVDNCDVRLPADVIDLVQRDVDWDAPDASGQASALIRQQLVDYVARYDRHGSAAAMEYADRRPRLDVASEFEALLEADTFTSRYAPRLRRHLLDYPAASGKGMSDFVYWSTELIRGRPVISITHVATVTAVDDSPVAYAVGSKQIYAMHYYDASLGLTLLVPDRKAGASATFIVYLNRSRIDLFDGVFGGMARRIVAGRARGLVAEQLQRLQRVMAE